MNEVGYRFEQRQRWALVAGSVVFGSLILLCLLAAIADEPRIALLALIWLVPLAGCQIALRDITRGHLFFGPDHVTQLGWRDQMLPIQAVRRVKWRPLTRSVKLYSPRGSLAIKLDKFEAADRIKIIYELRTRTASAKHLDWPRFCHQYAVKLVERLSPSPDDLSPNREPAEDEYFVSRKRFGSEWAVVSGICSLAWLAFVGLTTTDALQLDELLASRQLTIQTSIFAVIPILAMWIGWTLMIARYPQAGRIRKKQLGSEHDQRMIKKAKRFGIPILLFGAIWTFAADYAFESIFGFSQEFAVVLAILTLLAIVGAAATVGGFLNEEETKQADFGPALNRWEQYEQALSQVRRPRIPGRRQKDQFIIR